MYLHKSWSLTSVDILDKRVFPFGSWPYCVTLNLLFRKPGPIGRRPALNSQTCTFILNITNQVINKLFYLFLLRLKLFELGSVS